MLLSDPNIYALDITIQFHVDDQYLNVFYSGQSPNSCRENIK